MTVIVSKIKKRILRLYNVLETFMNNMTCLEFYLLYQLLITFDIESWSLDEQELV